MKYLLHFLIFTTTTIFCADKKESTTFTFPQGQTGTYDNEILKKSGTLNSILGDIEPSNDPIPLNQMSKPTFDILFDWMKKSDNDISKDVQSKKKAEVITLLENATFLDIPNIEEILTQRLFDIIISPKELSSFLSNPQTFLSSINIDISSALATKLLNHHSVQRTLLQIALGKTPYQIGSKKDSFISCVALSARKNYLAVSHITGITEIFDLHTKDLLRVLIAPEKRAYAIQFSPDEKELAIAYEHKKVHFWNIETGKISRTFDCPIAYDKQFIDNTLCFSHDNKYLIFAPGDASIKIIDTTGEAPIHNAMHPRHPCAVNCSSNNYLAVACIDGSVDLRNLSNPNFTSVGSMNTSTNTGPSAEISTINFSHDNRRLAVGSVNKTIRIYDLLFKRKKIDIHQVKTMRKPMKHFDIFETVIQSLDFSPDNQWLACHEYSGDVDIYDIHQGDKVITLNSFSQYGATIFSHDGTMLVSCSTPLITIWDLGITKRRLPLGTLMLLYACNNVEFSKLLKKLPQDQIAFLLQEVTDEQDRNRLSKYITDMGKKRSKQ